MTNSNGSDLCCPLRRLSSGLLPLTKRRRRKRRRRRRRSYIDWFSPDRGSSENRPKAGINIKNRLQQTVPVDITKLVDLNRAFVGIVPFITSSIILSAEMSFGWKLISIVKVKRTGCQRKQDVFTSCIQETISLLSERFSRICKDSIAQTLFLWHPRSSEFRNKDGFARNFKLYTLSTNPELWWPFAPDPPGSNCHLQHFSRTVSSFVSSLFSVPIERLQSTDHSTVSKMIDPCYYQYNSSVTKLEVSTVTILNFLRSQRLVVYEYERLSGLPAHLAASTRAPTGILDNG